MAAAALAGRRRSARITELDAYRGICALLVVTFHSYQPTVGQPGPNAMPLDSFWDIVLRSLDAILPMFFVLSGLAVMLPLGKLVLAGKPLPTAWGFLKPRLQRIVPVYLVAVLVVWQVRYAGTTEQWLDLLRAVTFTQVWSTGSIFRLIAPGWYLCVELHWYLLIAFVGLPLLRWAARAETERGRTVRLLALPALLTAIAALWKGIAIARGVPLDAFGTWFAPPCWGACYAVGTLLGLWLAKKDGAPTPLPRTALLGLAALALGVLGFAMSNRGIHGAIGRAIYFEEGAIACVIALIGTIHCRERGLFRRLMRSAPLQWLAGLSFGIFVWHDPILRGLKSIHVFDFSAAAGGYGLILLASWILATLAGWFSMVLIERPALHFGRLLRIFRDAAPSPRILGSWIDRTGVPLPPAALRWEQAGTPVDPTVLADQGNLVVLVLPEDPPPMAMPELAGSVGLLRAVRDSYFALRAQDTDVVVVMRGAPRASDGDLCRREGLPFPILRDLDGTWISALGIPQVEAGGLRTSHRGTVVVRRGGEIVRWAGAPELEDEAGELRRAVRALA